MKNTLKIFLSVICTVLITSSTAFAQFDAATDAAVTAAVAAAEKASDLSCSLQGEPSIVPVFPEGNNSVFRFIVKVKCHTELLMWMVTVTGKQVPSGPTTYTADEPVLIN